jgi:demethylsterigmatocystin 6-O-methyltransferase
MKCANLLVPTYQALPELLASTDYRNPTDPKNTAVQIGFNSPNTNLVGILSKKPEAMSGFGTLVATWGEGQALLQQLYPVRSLIDTYDEAVSPVMFVDVRGRYGQKAIALRRDFPHLPGRVIVQDLPMTIQRAPAIDGIELAAHDISQGHPSKVCARAFFLCRHPADSSRAQRSTTYGNVFTIGLTMPASTFSVASRVQCSQGSPNS